MSNTIDMIDFFDNLHRGPAWDAAIASGAAEAFDATPKGQELAKEELEYNTAKARHDGETYNKFQASVMRVRSERRRLILGM